MAPFRLEALVLNQNAQKLYLFPMNSTQLKQLCYVTPRSKDSPEEIQRLLDEKRAKEIGEYIKNDTSLLPNAVVISLNPEVSVTPTGSENEVTIEFPSDNGKFAYVLDGQHRLAGFDHSDGVKFDLPVVALYDATEDQRGKVFADINSKQVRVSDVHLLELYYQIKELPSEESATMDIVHKLAKDNDSPLCGKIKLTDDQKNAWVKNKRMKQCIAPHAEGGGVLHGKTPAAQVQIFKEYLKGVKSLWPTAWGNNKDYMLTKPMGIEIIFSIFSAAKHRCDLNSGKQYTSENFKSQMQPLSNCSIEIPGGGEIPLTWQAGPFGALSNATGRVLISKQLRNVLIEADHEE